MIVPTKNSSLFGPEPITEIVLTWYQGTPEKPGPVNFQFYGFRGHHVPLEEVLKILEIVHTKLAQEFVRLQQPTNGPAPAVPVEVPAHV